MFHFNSLYLQSQLMGTLYIGISQKDIDSLTEQLICLGFLCKKNEGTYQTGYIELLSLSKNGWTIYGKVKGY